EADLTINDGSDYFVGGSIDFDGERIIVSAAHNGNWSSTDAAYIFKREGNNWVIEQKLTALDDANFQYPYRFGDTVAIEGNHALVTRMYKPQVYLFVLN